MGCVTWCGPRARRRVWTVLPWVLIWVLTGCPDSSDDDATAASPSPTTTETPAPSPTQEVGTPAPVDCGDDDATETEPDADGDRYFASEDCDDQDPLVNPGRPETPYDGRDNDCDPTTPDDDLDSDGVGVADDCDDDDPEVAPGLTESCDGEDNDCNGEVDDNTGDWWYLDADGDGHGDAAQAVLDCDGFLRYVDDDSDCDDLETTVYPGADEVCDGLDNDCDGTVDEDVQTAFFADQDGDGHGDPDTVVLACALPAGGAELGDDCDDTDAAVHPGAEEVCNGLDDDCDTLVDDADDDVTGLGTFFADNDQDGYGDPNSPVHACTGPDSAVDTGTDCDDGDGAVHPDAEEVCNGLDDDCDGAVDEADDDLNGAVTFYLDRDGDGYGDPEEPVQACSLPDGASPNGDDCDDGDPDLNPDTVWYADSDGDGFGGDQTVTACEAPSGHVAVSGDCNDTVADIHPDATEVCNGLDDDCDGLIDAADGDLADGDTFFADSDGDGFGDPTVTMFGCQPAAGFVMDFSDCDDTNPDVSPGAEETWYDDLDSNCDGNLDPDPCTDPPPPSSVTIDDSCTYTPEPGAFSPVIQWAIETFDEYSSHVRIYSTPMVGQMTDDNGDGVIDDLDTPDIVVTCNDEVSSTYAGVTRLVSGDGTAIHWSVGDLPWDGKTYAPYRYSGSALGDIDRDGSPEIVLTLVRSTTCYPGALGPDGTVKWIHTDHTIECRNNTPAIHDLEGDGDVEVIFGRLILNGSDGSLQGQGNAGWGYNPSYSNSGYHAFAIDLDGDGIQEVIAGNALYGPDGASLCSTGYDDGYPAAADLDGDGLGEFVVTGNGYVRIFRNDCSYVKGWALLGGGWGGPATIADFDGDGNPEIGVAGTTRYVVYEVDGRVLWNMPVVDESSNSTGSSVFDFEGDGSAEVVYGDETRLWVFDGATGTVLLEDASHASGTMNEYPTIADVDGDGKAEIVVVNSRDPNGLYVIGDEHDNWVSARQVWNQQAYYITNIEDDLSIPSQPEPNWPRFNSFRQGAPGSTDPAAAPNLYPVAHAPCAQACAGQVAIIVQVANDGLVRVRGDLILAIYGEDANGNRTELDAVLIEDPIEPGTLSEPWVFTLDLQVVTGFQHLIVTIDADETFNECDEDDNEVLVTL